MSGLKFVNLSSAIQATEVEDKVLIKGFASVSAIDRDREIVPDPREFDIESFMASPTLLMDHKFLKDEFGNDQVAGVVKNAVAGVIKEETEDEFKIHSLETGEFVDSIERRIAPKLQVGSKGLFITAEVRHPIAREKVISGEMGGFSWRGIVRKNRHGICDDGEVCRHLKAIDLIEISIVHHPNQPQSTFMLAKSVDGEIELSREDLREITAYGVRFLKSSYPSVETVKSYMKAHDIDITSLEEDDTSFVAYTATPSGFDCSKSVSIPMGGVEFISAPEKEHDELIGSHVGQLHTQPVEEKIPMADAKTSDNADNGQAKVSEKRMRLFFLDEQGLLTRFPGLLTQSMKSITTTEGEEIEVLTLEIPEDGNPQEDTDAKAEQEQEVVSDDPEKTKPNPELEALRKEIAELRDSLKPAKEPVAEQSEAASVETSEPQAQDTETQEPENSERSEIEQIKDQLEAATKRFAETSKENDQLKNTLKSLVDKYNKLTPSHPAREETVEKSVDTEPADPLNSVRTAISRSFFHAR